MTLKVAFSLCHAFVEQVLRNKNRIKTEQVKRLPWPGRSGKTATSYKSQTTFKAPVPVTGLKRYARTISEVLLSLPESFAAMRPTLLLPAQRYYPDFEGYLRLSTPRAERFMGTVIPVRAKCRGIFRTPAEYCVTGTTFGLRSTRLTVSKETGLLITAGT